MHETSASLRIFGDDLDPDEITAALGRQPDAAERRGDTIRKPSGRERIARSGRWSIKTDSHTSGGLDAQIAELLSGMTEDMSVWRGITSRYKVDLFCGLFLEGYNEGITISPTNLKALGDRGIELDLDIYALLDEDNDE